MSQLANLQTGFQAFLMHKDKAFMSRIVDDEKVGANTRLNIYYNGYRLRIIEALATAYPKLHAWLGDDLFDSTARSYIDHYPSTFCNMRWVGDRMQAHLQNTLKKYPITSEMAQFEWALGLAFDAEDAPILQLADLAKIAPEAWGALQFNFHPSVQLLPTTLNVVAIWKALDADKKPPKPKKIKQHTLVWRHELDSYFRSIEPAEYTAIQSIKAGANFAQLCESLEAESTDAATKQAAQYLSAWLNDGLLQKTGITEANFN